MANSISALKRVRQTKARTQENRVVKTRIKSTKKAALEALASGDGAAIEKSVRQLHSATDRAVKTGAVHANYARRLKSKFAAKVAGAKA